MIPLGIRAAKPFTTFGESTTDRNGERRHALGRRFLRPSSHTPLSTESCAGSLSRLIALLVLLQYPLWLGKGGWLRAWDVDRQLQEQKESNKTLEVRNAALDAEVRDLKQGYDAIEERARSELGMIKQDEVFVQIPERAADKAVAGKKATPPAAK